MESEFTKRLDDVIRQELLILGYDYADVVASVEDGRGGGDAVARLQPPYEDLSFEAPQEDEPQDMFSARVRRRLKVALEAPAREPSPGEEP